MKKGRQKPPHTVDAGSEPVGKGTANLEAIDTDIAKYIIRQ